MPGGVPPAPKEISAAQTEIKDAETSLVTQMGRKENVSDRKDIERLQDGLPVPSNTDLKAEHLYLAEREQKQQEILAEHRKKINELKISQKQEGEQKDTEENKKDEETSDMGGQKSAPADELEQAVPEQELMAPEAQQEVPPEEIPAPEPEPAPQSGYLELQYLGNPSNVSLFNSTYAEVPDNIKQKLRDGGVVIYLTTETIAQTEFSGAYPSVMGCCHYGDSVYIKIEDRKKAVTSGLKHEIGHAIDGLNDFVYSQGIEAYRNAEGEALLGIPGTNRHDISGNKEYWAECFQQYLKGTLQSRCPGSWEYVNGIVSTM